LHSIQDIKHSQSRSNLQETFPFGLPIPQPLVILIRSFHRRNRSVYFWNMLHMQRTDEKE
jgi:hypothetical protein